MKTRTRLGAAFVVVFAGASAQATPLLELTPHHLSSAYSSGPQTFTAVGVAGSDMSVQRFLGSIGLAQFGPPLNSGGGGGTGGFSLSLSVIPSGSHFTGTGSFTATDLHGDTITASIDNGIWSSAGGDQIFFTGDLSNAQFHNNSGTGIFNGNTGSFSFGDLLGQSFNGSIVSLTTTATGAGFFTHSFTGGDTGGDAQIQQPTVPLPPAAWTGMATLVGVMVVRRLRRDR